MLDVVAGLAGARGLYGAEAAALSAGLIVVGPPGSGKSTLLRNINWLLEKRCAGLLHSRAVVVTASSAAV